MIFRFTTRNLAIATVLTLGACAGTTGIAQVETALTAAEHAATVYVTQPACAPGARGVGCSDPTTVTKIKAADNVAYTAVVGARTGKVSTADAMAAVTALTALIPVQQ